MTEINKNKTKISLLLAYARGRLIGRYSVCIMIIFCELFIRFLIDYIVSYVSGSDNLTVLQLAITFIINILFGVLAYGESLFFLRIANGEDETPLSDLFYGFTHNTDKALLIQLPFVLLSSLFSLPFYLNRLGFISVSIFESSLLAPLITSIMETVAMLIVNMFLCPAYYVLCDSPDMSISEIYRTSFSIMKNKKGRYFAIRLSLFPIYVLSLFTFGIGLLLYQPYLNTVQATFYLDENRRLKQPILKD